MGTWPGPSTITCTPASNALCASSASTFNSYTCARSNASAKAPGRMASPKLRVTSNSFAIANISSYFSYSGFSCPLWIIHSTKKVPPRLTTPQIRLFSFRCLSTPFVAPQCTVIKSTPSSQCNCTASSMSFAVMSTMECFCWTLLTAAS